MKKIWYSISIMFILAMFLMVSGVAGANVPFIVNHQGSISKEGVPLEKGDYEFRFAIVDNTATILWSNDGSHVGESAAGIHPDDPVTLSVAGGRYSVALGDTTLTNMVALQPSVFTEHENTFLRVWFNKTGESPQRFEPDVQMVSVPYAYKSQVAESVNEGSISAEHAGRSSQVKSIFFKSMVDDTNSLIYTVPADTTFVLTDIFVVRIEVFDLWGIRDRNSTSNLYLELMLDSSDNLLYNHHIGFNAGVVFEPESHIYIRREEHSESSEVIMLLSGYEF